MEQSLKGKVAFITGAALGIGATIAETLSRQGASITILDRRSGLPKELEDKIAHQGGKVLSVVGDVSKPEDIEKAINLTVERFGRLDLAVNNAGISGDFGLLHESSIENWRKVMSVNLDGIFYGMKYEISAMLKTGGGSIVNICSVEGTTILPQNPAYTASKHAIHGITKTAAFDYAKKNIRINTVSPGVINTPLVASKPEVSSQMAAVIPVGRMGTTQEIANAVAFVLSDQASYMTGTELIIDGAFLLRQG